MFIRNAWYVAGFGHELEAGKLLSRTFLNERVVMYRKADGAAVALSDRCPHRFVPLHIGKVKGDGIQCGYHGLEFGADGVCTHNPHGDGKIVANMRVKSYPLAEQDGLLWIWMGEASQADPAKITRFPYILDPKFRGVFGYMHVGAAYQLVNDNLMDLSHADYVHPIFQHAEKDPITPDPPQMTFGRDCDTLWSKLLMGNTRPTPLMSLLKPELGRVNSWIDSYWNPPSLMYLDIGCTPVGGRKEDALEHPSVHLLTPETEGSTHYFWNMARNVRLDDEGLSAQVYAGIDQAFAHEDKPIIEMQQDDLGDADLMDQHPVLLQTDTVAVQARRIIRAKLEAEATASHVNAAE